MAEFKRFIRPIPRSYKSVPQGQQLLSPCPRHEQLLKRSLGIFGLREVWQMGITNGIDEKWSSIRIGNERSIPGQKQLLDDCTKFFGQNRTRFGANAEFVISHTHPSIEFILKGENACVEGLRPLSSQDLQTAKCVAEILGISVRVEAVTASHRVYSASFRSPLSIAG